MFIPGPAGRLELALRFPEGVGMLSGSDCCAVVCHPHPLHGGTMDNKVVTTLVRVYGELGLPVVRFNFRGVGGSDGAHDGGVGEIEDLLAVAEWLQSRVKAGKVLLAGFSFGCCVVSHGCREITAATHAVFVAPPVGRYNFSPAVTYPCPLCVVIGGKDELVDGRQVYGWAKSLTPAPGVVAIAGASHFFHGHLTELRQQLVREIAARF